MREQCKDCGKWSNDLPRHLANTCKHRALLRTPLKRTGIRKKAKAKNTPAWYKQKAIKAWMKQWHGQPCAICGSTQSTCGHHIVAKGRTPSLVISPENIVVLCSKHHLFDRDICPHSRNSLTVHRFNLWMATEHEEQWNWCKCHENDTSLTVGKIDWKAKYEELT
jgi:hypothetical protein